MAVDMQPAPDQALKVEAHGIDFIPESERWARPPHLAGMWAGASVQVEYFIYGAVLMSFGFNFAQALSLIIIGNLSYFLLGLCSLQGPDAGTTVFAINRASYGPNGSRLISLFNWLTQIGFEIEGLLLIVGAGLILSNKAGFDPGKPAEVIFIIGAVLIQAVLPFLGHAAIVKSLRALVLPFVALFVVMLVFAVQHGTTHGVAHGADWQTYMEGLAFTIALSGLGWTECGNDYSRYLPKDSKPSAIVGWVFLGTAVPEILIMTLGAAVGTFLMGIGGGATGKDEFLPFLGAQTKTGFVYQHMIPSWFVVVFLAFAIVQLFCINSLDLYSSGVTLQAMGLKIKRYQAVMLDSVVCLLLTLYAFFSGGFTTYLKDFVDLVIVWIAPWMAIYLVDWGLRKWRYVAGELQRTDKGGLYYGSGGVFWPAIIAQILGMAASMEALAPTFSVPHWANYISYYTNDSYGYGADFSVFTGIFVGAVVYLVLATSSVRAQSAKQDELLAAV